MRQERNLAEGAAQASNSGLGGIQSEPLRSSRKPLAFRVGVGRCRQVPAIHARRAAITPP